MSSRLFSATEMAEVFGGPVFKWTPELWDSSNSGAEGQVYAVQNSAKGFRIGNFCFIHGRLDLALTGAETLTGTDTAKIGNLPWSCVGGFPPAHFYIQSGVGSLPGTDLSGIVGINNSISLQSAGIDVTIADISATGDYMFSAWYITNDAL